VGSILDSRRRRGRAGVLTSVSIICGAAFVVLTIAPLRAVTAPFPSRDDAASAAEQMSSRRSSPLDRALLEASEDGDVDAIARLIAAGANVNAAISGDGSPLIAAARGGKIEAVKLLLEHGATVDMGVTGDGNALIMAAREGHVPVVEMLLDRGASIDQIVPGDENALIQASGSGQLPVVKLLVSRGADVNARAWADGSGRSGTGEWRTPLGMARRGGHTAVESFLISAGARQ
jgi:bla regulator protein blaR1